MWDISIIQSQNEQAHREAIERAQGARTPTPLVFPLSILARRLLIVPPSLAALMDLFANSEAVKAFVELVREYLPDHEAEIMSQDLDNRMRKFCEYFNSRYFPLADRVYGEIELEEFVAYIPVDLMGFSYGDYHEFADFRMGYILLLSLVVYPYWEGYESEEEVKACSRGLVEKPVGGRLPIIEKVEELVGADLASLIPPNVWQPEKLHSMTDGAKYEGCGHFADWVCSCTNCMVLDATYEDYSENMWDRDLVDVLTAQWPKVQEIQEKITRMADWLEEDPRTNFRELMSFLLDRKDLIVPKEQIPLPLHENGQVKPQRLMQIFSQEEATDGEN